VIAFALRYHPEVVERDIPALDPAIRKRIRRALELRLVTHPEKYGKPLRQSLSGLRKLRVGDWRVIYLIRGTEVWILRIGHRREVYQEASRPIPEES